MKYSFLCLILLYSLSAVAAPEIIVPKTKIVHSLEWYEDQAAQWKAELGHRSNDPMAWANYYAASRYAQNAPEELSRIVSEMEKWVSGTYELFLVQGWDRGLSIDAMEMLGKAFAMRPEDPSSYSSLLLLNEFLHNTPVRKEFSQRAFRSGLISSSLMNYSYNVLMSLEKDAILFVEGDNTTIPLFVIQDVMQIRTDVVVLNLDMMMERVYREGKLIMAGLKGIEIEINKSALCAELPKTNPDRNFYYALTLPKETITAIREQLYVVGLASRLSKDRLDNISLIKENLENRFLLDYLTVDFNGENTFAAGKVYNSNYLVPMLLLNERYTKSGELMKAKELEELVIRIARESGKSGLVDNFLHHEMAAVPPFVLFKLNMKEIEESYKPVKGNLYALKTEVTNSDYNDFLDFLKQNNQTDLYEKCKVDLSQYDKISLAYFTGYHMPYHHWKKASKQGGFNSYPIVNITYEGAKAYCEWLTEQYNNNPDKKFKKVKFRLPTLMEWQIAALGYKKFQSWNLDENEIEVAVPKGQNTELGGEKRTIQFKGSEILYPWWSAYNFRNKPQNSRNCWLGNFKTPENCKPCMTLSPGKDGYAMIAPVAQYFPNGMGLFDVVGNVAEMIDEKGKACGGSWNQTPEESTIMSVGTYTGAGPNVGFRIFMEVLEP